ncbi:MAG: hypothetical protein ACU0B9_17835 [Limimaricola soesokkakensis]|uniref:hypothetical protein n=1 Tax=Limimaricola soesokkakensis TaxID=1343159 RepID=UPI004059B1F8
MSFVIGTNPVVRMTHNNDENLITGDVEMWATMAPDLAFVLSKRGLDGDLHYLSSEKVIRLNSAIYKQSRAVAARSKEALQILPAMA